MRSFLVIIFVAQAALICLAQFEEKLDYSAIKLRKVDVGQDPIKSTEKPPLDLDDNKARVASIWGIKLKPVNRNKVTPVQEEPVLKNVILAKPAVRAQQATDSGIPTQSSQAAPAPVKAVENTEPEVLKVQHQEKAPMPVPVQVREPEPEPEPEPAPAPESKPKPIAASKEEEVAHDNDDGHDDVDAADDSGDDLSEEETIHKGETHEPVEDDESSEDDDDDSGFGQLVKLSGPNDHDDHNDHEEDEEDDYWPLKAAMRRSGM